MLFAEANLHGLRVTLLHDAQVVDVIRTMNREGKLNTWVSVQYATPEVREIVLLVFEFSVLVRALHEL